MTCLDVETPGGPHESVTIRNQATDGKTLFYTTHARGRTESPVFALDPACGVQRWIAEVGDLPRSLTCDGDAVFVGLTSSVVLLDKASGEVRWRHPTGPIRNWCGAAFGEGVVVWGAGSGDLFCAESATGDLLWQLTLPDGISAIRPLVCGATVVAACKDRFLRGVDLQEGEERWAIELDGFVDTQLAAESHLVVCTAMSGTTYCVDTRRGAVRWKRELRRDSVISGPLVADGTVYVIAFVPEFLLDSRPMRAPVLLALDLSSGDLVSRTDPSPFRPSGSTPLLWDGRLLVHGDRRWVHAFEVPETRNRGHIPKTPLTKQKIGD